MGIDSHLSTCVGTQSPKYLEMAQGHISLSNIQMCKVKWSHHSEEEANWEREDDLKAKYPELFASQP
jgi:hypothetical protein